ncbi:hypothetical protein HNP38_002545 [Chryseobacterium defluvii]|uniref:Uncharacterized protein n=1 Tax=Chryseobacterium defluvii TaxID=160396 RepID=A0A840KCX4_9FLAO|nr:hypothetical protein [Chryseobacterium defluvii]MBB4807241.1 hypothetical protein [Chryseobacterium defluvii]
MEKFDDEFGDLSQYKILSFEEVTKGFTENKNPFGGVNDVRSFEEISYDKKFGNGEADDKCVATNGNFYAENMKLNDLLNDLDDQTNEKFFFYYQNYALDNPTVDLGSSPSTMVPITTTYAPPKYFEYTRGNEKKAALLSVELNDRACFISLKDYGSRFYLSPEKEEILFELKFVYTDYLDKRVFNQATGEYELEKKYNAVIISTSDGNGYVALSEKLKLRNDAKNEIITLFTEKVKETQDPSALKFLYENIPDFVIEGLLSKLEGKFDNEAVLTKDKKTGKVKSVSSAQLHLWGHLEKLVKYDDQGALSWTTDSSGALLNLLKIFRSSSFLFESFKNDQAMVKRIFGNMNKTSVLDGKEWSNKTLFANFITALCIDNAFNGLRILDEEFTIGNDYAVSSGSVFQGEKDNEFFLQQMKKKAEGKTVYTPGIVPGSPGSSEEVTSYYLEETEEGNLYHPMDIVRIKYADIKEAPFPFVSAMTIKAFAEERDQQLRADAIRIGFDVLAIVLGVVFFPAGGAIGIAAEAIGIGLALADIGITANREDIEQSPGGKEFLDTWNKVYLVGGLTLASAAMVEQVFAKSVFCYLEALKSGSPLLQAYEKSLGKILLEREILTFAGNTLKPSTEISVKILAYNSDKISKATAFAFGKYDSFLPLYEKGAILVEIGEKEYALVYKGEKLIQGTPNDKKVLEFYQNLKKNQKRLGEVLEELKHEGGAYGESIVATTVKKEVKAFEEGLKQFSKITAKPFDHIKEAMPYFNHKSVGNAVKQVDYENCGNTAEVVVEFLKTGKLRLAEPSGYQDIEVVAAKCGGGSFQPSTIPRMKQLMAEGDIVVVYGIKEKVRIKGTIEESTKGHFFVGMKKGGELHLFDGQTGEYVIYDVTSSKARNFLQRNYLEFKYTKVRK